MYLLAWRKKEEKMTENVYWRVGGGWRYQ